MKNLLFTLFILPTILLGQIKVHTSGNVSVGGETTPRAILDINQNSATSTTSQFGTFGIQSFASGNGFLLGNGFWNGSALQAYDNGAVNLIQFNNNIVRIRTTPAILAGQTTVDLQNNITAKYGGATGAIVGINTMTPGNYNLYVQGTAFKTDGNSSWDIASDGRLKKNIVSFDSGLEIINKMNIVEYEYNGIAGTIEGEKHIGIIAQEIMKFAPFMINEFQYTADINKNNDEETIKSTDTYLSFNDSSLPFILVNAIKQQQKQIEFLKKELEVLKSSLTPSIEGSKIFSSEKLSARN
jgi:hypothetical protein